MRKAMVDKGGAALSVRRQCELLGVNRKRLDPRPAAARARGFGDETSDDQRARIKGKGSVAYYHCISRVVDRAFVLGEVEKEAFVKILRRHEAF